MRGEFVEFGGEILGAEGGDVLVVSGVGMESEDVDSFSLLIGVRGVICLADIVFCGVRAWHGGLVTGCDLRIRSLR